MRDLINPRGGKKQIWVVVALSLVLALCVGMLLWLVWSEPDGLPASMSEGQTSASLSSSSRLPSSSSKSKSPSKSESSPVSQSGATQSSRPASGTAAVSTPTAQTQKNLTINAALTHDENATYYNVFINADGVTLKNKLVTGDLVLSESVGNGAVTLENVVVKGRILVNGAQTVTLNDVTAVSLIAQRSSGTTDYIVEGASTIHQMTAKNQLTISESGLSTNYAGIKKLTTEQGTPVWQQVTLLRGALEQVTTNEATNLMLSGGSVDTVIANAPTHIGGSGTVYNLIVCSNNVSYEKKSRNITIEDDYTQPEEQNWAIGETEAAVNGGDHSGPSSQKLSMPGNLTIAAAEAENSVMLSFDSVSHATGYTILYSVANGSSASNVSNQSVSVDTNSYTLTHALIGQADTVISFKVRAFSSSSRYTTSSYSSICTKTVSTLDAPSDVTLTFDGSTLALSFTAADNAAANSHEAVLSCGDTTLDTLTLTAGETAGEFADTNPGETHTVTVRAIGDGRLVLSSPTATATCDVPPLPKVSDLAIISAGSDPAVTFTGADGVSDYTVTLRYDDGSPLSEPTPSVSGGTYTYVYECPDDISDSGTYTASVTPAGGVTSTVSRAVEQCDEPETLTIRGDQDELILEFTTNSRNTHDVVVQISTDGGTIWTEASSKSVDVSTTETNQTTATMPTLPTSATSMKVRFVVTAKAANAFEVDSDAVPSSALSVVQLAQADNLSVIPVTDSGYYAVFSFDEVINAASYTVSYTLDDNTWADLDPINPSGSGTITVREPISPAGATVSSFTVTAHAAQPAEDIIYLDSEANYPSP